MILLVLVVIWVIALAPMAIRLWRERSVASSVSRFHRQIGGLRRAYPRLVAASLDGRSRGVAEGESRDRTSALAGPDSGRRPAGSRGRRSRAGLAARRRLILSRLATATATAFLLGLVPALRFLWALALLGLVATVSYVALLAYVNGVVPRRREAALAVAPPTVHPLVSSPWSRPAVSVVAVHRPSRRAAEAHADDEVPARVAARG